MAVTHDREERVIRRRDVVRGEQRDDVVVELHGGPHRPVGVGGVAEHDGVDPLVEAVSVGHGYAEHARQHDGG